MILLLFLVASFPVEGKCSESLKINRLPLNKDKNNYSYVGRVSAYNTGDKSQTDDSPCIGKKEMKKTTKKDHKKEVKRKFLRPDLPTCVPWRAIEEAWGKMEFNRFMKWMNGQTCLSEGAYSCDVISYAHQRNRGIKEPNCFD